MQNSATRRLSRLERVSLLLLFGLVVAFLGMVELRSAFLSRRMGDLTCYLRPAWGALVGEDIYALKDPNGYVWSIYQDNSGGQWT